MPGLISPRATRIAALAVLLVLSWPPAFAEDRDPAKQPDPDLVRSVNAIRESFRSGQPGPMSAVLPAAGRVYLAVRRIAADASFYSADQILALLRQAFSGLRTVQFHINMEMAGAPGGEGPAVVCPAAWSYLDHGARGDLRLRFLLTRRPEGWTLSEIRETR